MREQIKQDMRRNGAEKRRQTKKQSQNREREKRNRKREEREIESERGSNGKPDESRKTANLVLPFKLDSFIKIPIFFVGRWTSYICGRKGPLV